MIKYLLNRLLRGLLSTVVVVGVVMLLIYSLMDRNLIFASDPVYSHMNNNKKITYKFQRWEEYGYMDYVTYQDYLQLLTDKGKITEDERSAVASFGRTADKDSDTVKDYVARFTNYYKKQGYQVVRLDAVMLGAKKYADGGQQQLFAYKNIPVINRLGKYFTSIFTVDNIHKVDGVEGKRGITFTLHDPAYGGEKFAPAVIGNGSFHKYLIYSDSKFPYIHQNIVNITLGKSYTINTGIDVFETLNKSQGSYVLSQITYPSGMVEESADDLHSATFLLGSRDSSLVNAERFTDDYTNVVTVKAKFSKIGFSFVMGILSVILSYLLGLPLGIVMARRKDGILDKIGTGYIVFITAVPSLAYIFIVKGISGKLGLPTTFDLESDGRLMYIAPVISLSLKSIADLMKWLRRYMIDQMNSDYVKFARSGGLTEGEIFRKHIFKNAVIPIVHGIPGSVLACLVGAIITERVYVVPGAGNVLTEAINQYDNGVIVGVTLFYCLLGVISIILGDALMAVVDPRISFSEKDR